MREPDPGDRSFTAEEGDLMRGPSTPLAELIESFAVNVEASLSPRTLRGYLHVLRAFDRDSGGLRLGELDAERVNRYVAERRRSHPAAARLAAATLRAFANWLRDSGLARDERGESVLSTVRIPRFDRERSPFTDADYERILGVLDGASHRTRIRDRALVLTLLGCGLRLGEARELASVDVHIARPLEHSYLTVRGETSKSGVDRTARIPPTTAIAIHNYLRDWRPEAYPTHGPGEFERLFLTEEGHPFTYHGMQRYLANIGDRMEAAGVRDFMAHRCRHFWATASHRAGSTERDLADEGGWRPGSKQIYRYTKRRPFEELQRKPTGLAFLERRRVG